MRAEGGNVGNLQSNVRSSESRGGNVGNLQSNVRPSESWITENRIRQQYKSVLPLIQLILDEFPMLLHAG